jgi:hypothetical protein
LRASSSFLKLIIIIFSFALALLVDMANATDPLAEVNQPLVATPFGTLLEKIDNKIDQMDTKIDQMDTKIDQMDTKLNNKIDQMDTKLNNKMDQMESLRHTEFGVILGAISLAATFFALVMGICPCYKPPRDVAAAPTKGPERFPF